MTVPVVTKQRVVLQDELAETAAVITDGGEEPKDVHNWAKDMVRLVHKVGISIMEMQSVEQGYGGHGICTRDKGSLLDIVDN